MESFYCLRLCLTCPTLMENLSESHNVKPAFGRFILFTFRIILKNNSPMVHVGCRTYLLLVDFSFFFLLPRSVKYHRDVRFVGPIHLEPFNKFWSFKFSQLLYSDLSPSWPSCRPASDSGPLSCRWSQGASCPGRTGGRRQKKMLNWGDVTTDGVGA